MAPKTSLEAEPEFEAMVRDYGLQLADRSAAYVERTLLLPRWDFTFPPGTDQIFHSFFNHGADRSDDGETDDSTSRAEEIDPNVAIANADPAVAELAIALLAEVDGDGDRLPDHENPVLNDFRERCDRGWHGAPSDFADCNRFFQANALADAVIDRRQAAVTLRRQDGELVQGTALALAAERALTGLHAAGGSGTGDAEAALNLLCWGIWRSANTDPDRPFVPRREDQPRFWALPGAVLDVIARRYDAYWPTPVDSPEAAATLVARDWNRDREAKDDEVASIDLPGPDSVPSDAEGRSWGWIVSMTSREYAATGDILELAVGGGPTLVEAATGWMYETGSGRATEWWVRQFEKARGYLSDGCELEPPRASWSRGGGPSAARTAAMAGDGFESYLREFAAALEGRPAAFLARSLRMAEVRLERCNWHLLPRRVLPQPWRNANAEPEDSDPPDAQTADLVRRILADMGPAGESDVFVGDPVLTDLARSCVIGQGEAIVDKLDPDQADVCRRYAHARRLTEPERIRRREEAVLLRGAALAVAADAVLADMRAANRADLETAATALDRLGRAVWRAAHTDAPDAPMLTPEATASARAYLPRFWALPPDILNWLEDLHGR